MRPSGLHAAALALAALALAPFPAAVADEYDIDPAHSFIQFRTLHLGFSWLVGRFNEFEGEFEYDPEDGEEDQEVEVTIDIDSLDSNHAERDRHLLSDDFLDADRHPEARFVSTSFSGDKEGGMLSGDLTLHGVTRPVTIAVRPIGEGKDPWGGYRAGFEGSVTIRAADFGIDSRAVDAVEIDLFVEGIRR